MEAKYVFDDITKELSSGGESPQVPEGGVGKFLFENMKEHAGNDHIAQIDGATGEEESFQAFLTKCIKLALFMRDQGLKQGDIISMCSQNTLDNAPVLIASLFIGVITASTDPLISIDDTKSLLGIVEPKLIFVCEESTELLRESSKDFDTKLIALHKHDSLEDLPMILEKYSEDDVKNFEPVYIEDLKDTAVILFSSGTTGLPKGACLNHIRLGGELSKPMSPPGTRSSGFTTLYWYSGALFCLASARSGMTRVCYRQFNKETVWDDLDTHKVNLLYVSYSHCMESIRYLNKELPYLKVVFIAGGQLAVNYYKEFKEKLPGTTLYTAYGMTEIGGVCGHPGTSPPESAGLLFPNGNVVRIVDPETELPLDLHQVGEIRVKGDRQMNGYYKKDSSDCWDDQGFFRTGDLGYFDDKYQLYIVDRIKEMFKYKSWHVVPAKMEQVLREHPAVQHGIVIGIPVEDNENHALAVVVLRSQLSEVPSNDELIKLVNDKMDDIHQIRAGVKFIKEEEIPYTVTGKVNRRKLKQMFC